MQNETAAIRESARHPLPYDVDRNLSRELESLAASLAGLTREAEQLAEQSGLKNGAAAQRLAELARRLSGGRKELRDKALAPIEHLALVYPLFEDQARFVQLYLRQRDLAERTTALKGPDGTDDPAKRARMRDLEAEQKQTRTELARLLDDIEDHARRLPDEAQLRELRETAQAFATAVRASGATEAMIDAEGALAAFAGSRAIESTKMAADILEKFLAQCTGGGAMCEACEGSLKFQPALAGNLGNSIEQMLANAGFPSERQIGKPGFGMGAGTGDGYSARQNNLNNVGLYGSMPTLEASARQGSSRSATAAGSGRGDGATAARRAPSLTTAPATVRATGTAQTAIPAPYRRRVADYFQRIADEIGDRPSNGPQQ
jgi:cell division septum initiation protein DivIVA